MNLLCTLVAKGESFKLDIGHSSRFLLQFILIQNEAYNGNRGGLIQELFHKCLFDIPTAENHSAFAPPKCKTKASRKAAFRLLAELAKNCPENFQELIEELLKQHPEGLTFLKLTLAYYLLQVKRDQVGIIYQQHTRNQRLVSLDSKTLEQLAT